MKSNIQFVIICYLAVVFCGAEAAFATGILRYYDFPKPAFVAFDGFYYDSTPHSQFPMWQASFKEKLKKTHAQDCNEWKMGLTQSLGKNLVSAECNFQEEPLVLLKVHFPNNTFKRFYFGALVQEGTDGSGGNVTIKTSGTVARLERLPVIGSSFPFDSSSAPDTIRAYNQAVKSYNEVCAEFKSTYSQSLGPDFIVASCGIIVDSLTKLDIRPGESPAFQIEGNGTVYYYDER